jgi:hypothetical protein
VSPEKEKLLLDAMWGLFTTLEYVVGEFTDGMGRLAGPVKQKLDDLKSALTELETME